MIREITNGNFRNCIHPTFMGNFGWMNDINDLHDFVTSWLNAI